MLVTWRKYESSSPWNVFRYRKRLFMDGKVADEHLKRNPAELWSMQLNDFSENITKQWTDAGGIISRSVVSCSSITNCVNDHHSQSRWQNDLMTRNQQPATLLKILSAFLHHNKKNSKIKMHNGNGNRKDFSRLLHSKGWCGGETLKFIHLPFAEWNSNFFNKDTILSRG